MRHFVPSSIPLPRLQARGWAVRQGTSSASATHRPLLIIVQHLLYACYCMYLGCQAAKVGNGNSFLATDVNLHLHSRRFQVMSDSWIALLILFLLVEDLDALKVPYYLPMKFSGTMRHALTYKYLSHPRTPSRLFAKPHIVDCSPLLRQTAFLLTPCLQQTVVAHLSPMLPPSRVLQSANPSQRCQPC